jgi:hypothetical protein
MAAKANERESGGTWWLFLYRPATGDLNLEMPHIQEPRPRHGPASASRPIPKQDVVRAAESDTLSKNYIHLSSVGGFLEKSN